MHRHQNSVIAFLALGGMMVFSPPAVAAEETKPANPPVEKKVEAAKPTAEDIARLEAEVGLTDAQKAKVNALLNELKQKRRAIKEDASLSSEEKRVKTTALNHEIQGKDGKIRVLMTAEQFAKWEKLQEARRAARD